MLDDIDSQRMNGLFRAKHCIHSCKVFFALFNREIISELCEFFILIIQLTQYLFIQLQLDHTAFIVHWTSSPILYSLRHIVHINVIAKYLSRAAIL